MAKEIFWHGKTEEEVKQMDLNEFMGFIPSRARRSLKRGIPENHKTVLQKLESNDNNVKTHCRDLVVVPKMLGKTIKIHNGKEYVSVTIILDMLGHSLGEFAHTRKYISHSAAGVGATRSSKAISAR